MTLTLGLDVDRVKLNQRTKYLGQRSFSSKVVERTFTDSIIIVVLLYLGTLYLAGSRTLIL